MAEILHYELDMDKRSQWQIVTVHPASKAGLMYVLEYGGKEYRLSAGQFFWIDCQNPQRYYTDPEIGRWHVLWVHFRGANARAYYEIFQSVSEGSPIGSLPAHGNSEELLQSLLARYNHSDSTVDNDIAASAQLTQLLAECIQSVNMQEENRAVPELVQQIREYLLNHYAENISLDTLSQQFSVSKYHLQRLFKKYTGQSPLEFLSVVRMTRAKELLRTTDMPVGDIAYAVGLENASYFVSKFRSLEDITPHRYRKSWSNG